MELTERRLPIIGLVGVVGFPVYYVVWAHLFPQPYENLPLRLALALLCLPLVFPRQWPGWLKRHRPHYLLALVFLCIPFFFSYMALRNGFSPAWSGSSVIALVMVFYLLDLAVGLIMLTAGAALAYCLALLTGLPLTDWSALLATLPILGFALVVMLALDLSAERITRARLATAATLSGHIAHELRTPFACIRAAARRMQEVITDARQPLDHARAKAVGPTGNELSRIPRDIGLELDAASLVIELLADNAGCGGHAAGRGAIADLRACAERALRRYPYPSPRCRGWVTLSAAPGAHFPIRADALILEHIVLNLLDNAVHAVQAMGGARPGRIEIALSAATRGVRLRVTDNGVGMSEAGLARAFEPFFTTRTQGSGLGLHFVSRAVAQAGGQVRCRSEPGAGTDLVVSLPSVADEQDRTRPLEELTAKP